MSAECYWCKTNIAHGSVPNAVGNRGEAIGCCHKCQILACGHHASRDPNRQEFKCYDCLFIKLIVSAVNSANLDANQKEILYNWDDAFGNRDHENEYYLDFNDFKKGNPQLKEWFQRIIESDANYSILPRPYREVFNNFDNNAKLFLIAAAYLIDCIEEHNLLDDDSFRTYLKKMVFGSNF